MITIAQTSANETTGPQVVGVGSLYDPRLPKSMPVSYSTYREMRKHPTVALCRLLLSAPILAANWSYERVNDEVPDEWVELITDSLGPVKTVFLENAVLGMIDFGWQPFEIVWGLNDTGQVVVQKAKALLQDNTDILVEPNTGAFAGFRQEVTGAPVDVVEDKALLINTGVEGTNWYGEGRLETARKAIEQWAKTEDGAQKYDDKVAGSHWRIFFPPGKTPYGANGDMTDNFIIADDIAASLTSSGVLKIPRAVSGYVEDGNRKDDQGWDVDIIGDGSARQYSYVARLQYEDKLIVRGMGLPERAVLEASMGTRADAGVHAQAAATTFDLMHKGVVADLNEAVVDKTLVTNYGPEAKGSVFISAAPITDVTLEFLQKVYLELLKDPSIRSSEYLDFDIEALRDKVNVPHEGEDSNMVKTEEEDDAGETTIGGDGSTGGNTGAGPVDDGDGDVGDGSGEAG